MKKLHTLWILGLATCAAFLAVGGPPLYLDIDANYQQQQNLPSLDLLAGAHVTLRVRLRSQRRWLSGVTNYTARWRAMETVTSTNYLQATATSSNEAGHYIEIPLNTDQTGNARTNWFYRIDVLDNGNPFAMGTGTLNIADSNLTIPGSILTADTWVARSELAATSALDRAYADTVAGTTGTAASNYVDATASTLSNSFVNIDGDNMTGTLGVPTVTNVNYVEFNTDYSDGSAEARLQWNKTDGTLEVGMPGGNVNLQIGQEFLLALKNVSGATISNGQAIAIAPAPGAARGGMILADADAGGITNIFDGLATEDVANNATGYVTVLGRVRGLDTSGFSEGDVVYLSTTPGGLTATEPSAPTDATIVGTVEVSHASNGVILVRPHAIKEWAELDARYVELTETDSIVTIDAANARTNTFGGLVTVLGSKVQSGTSTASGNPSVAFINSTASGNNSFASGNGSTASGNFATAMSGGQATGSGAFALGTAATASGLNSVALQTSTADGELSMAAGNLSHAYSLSAFAWGNACIASNDAALPNCWAIGSYARATDWGSFVWNQDLISYYDSHGNGTFNINPTGGAGGFYIGESTLTEIQQNASGNTLTNLAVGTASDYAATVGQMNASNAVDQAYTDTQIATRAVTVPIGACSAGNGFTIGSKFDGDAYPLTAGAAYSSSTSANQYFSFEGTCPTGQAVSNLVVELLLFAETTTNAWNYEIRAWETDRTTDGDPATAQIPQDGFLLVTNNVQLATTPTCPVKVVIYQNSASVANEHRVYGIRHWWQ